MGSKLSKACERIDQQGLIPPAPAVMVEDRVADPPLIHDARFTSYYLALDTETTGLPSRSRRPPDEDGQPPAKKSRYPAWWEIACYDRARLVSVGVVLYGYNQSTHTATPLVHYYSIVRPDGYHVRATEIHGITHEQALREGRPLEEVVQRIHALLPSERISGIIGHNIEFDFSIIQSELYRCYQLREHVDMFTDYKPCCTLKLARASNLNLDNYKLGTVYKHLCSGNDKKRAHHALDDAVASAEIFFSLIGVSVQDSTPGAPDNLPAPPKDVHTEMDTTLSDETGNTGEPRIDPNLAQQSVHVASV